MHQCGAAGSAGPVILLYEGASRQSLPPAILLSEPCWVGVVYRRRIVSVVAIWRITTAVVSITPVRVVSKKPTEVKSAAIPESKTAGKRHRSRRSEPESGRCTECGIRPLRRSRTEGCTARRHGSIRRTGALCRGGTECYAAGCETSTHVRPAESTESTEAASAEATSAEATSVEATSAEAAMSKGTAGKGCPKDGK